VQIQDIYPYAIALSWKQASGASGPSTNGAEGAEDGAQGNQIVFTKANPLPSSKLLTFYRTETFTIDAFYADAQDMAPDYNLRIGAFTVSAPRSAGGQYCFRMLYFTVQAQYSTAYRAICSTFVIPFFVPFWGFRWAPSAPSRPDNEKPKLKVKLRLNLNGILSFDSATVSEAEWEVLSCKNRRTGDRRKGRSFNF